MQYAKSIVLWYNFLWTSKEGSGSIGIAMCLAIIVFANTVKRLQFQNRSLVSNLLNKGY